MTRLLLSLVLTSPTWADQAKIAPLITVVLDSRGSSSAVTMAEMKAEVRSAMSGAGIAVDFKLRGEVESGDSFADLIVVKLNGHCEMDSLSPMPFDERGPDALAYTHSSDGQILPFAEVPCDRLRTSVQAAMWGGDVKRANSLLGRAIGRVLSHEFFHILANTSGHGRDGIARKSLSASQLIAEKLSFESRDANLLRLKLNPAAAAQPQSDLP